MYKTPERQKIRLKLINMPCLIESSFAFDFNAMSMPPFSIGVLASRLREEGYRVDVDDLNIKYHRRKGFNISLFSDLERVLAYIDDTQDKQLSAELFKIFNMTDMDSYDKFLLSYGDDAPGTNYKGFFLASLHYLKKRYGKPIIAGTYAKRFHYLLGYIKDKDLIDYLIIGYGEESLIGLLTEKNHNEIPGLVYAKGKIYPLEKMNNVYNLNIIPDFNGLPMNLYHRKIEGSDVMMMPFKLNYGCVGSCAFCFESGFKKRSFDTLDPLDAVKRLADMKKRYDCSNFIFFDSTFNISTEFVKEFCDAVKDYNLDIRWMDSGRFAGLNINILKRMKESGCMALIFGLESASQRMIDYIGKNIKIEEVSSILRASSKVGIWNGVDLIAGLPHETDADISSTINFMNSHKNVIDEYWLNAFTMRETSLFAKYPERYGITNLTMNHEGGYKGAGKGLDYQSIIYSFDEKNGLPWKKKKRQINDAFHNIKQSINLPYHIPVFNHYPILFHLYSKYNKKELIRKEYHKMRRNINARRMMNPSFLLSQLRSVTGPKMLYKKLKMQFTQ